MTSKLHSRNELVEDVHLPPEFAAALTTARSELVKMVNRPLSPEETRQVAHAFAVLIDTNRELQRHNAQVVQEIETLRSHLKGALTAVERLRDVADFREPIEGDDSTEE
jgi:hypothetical protein